MSLTVSTNRAGALKESTAELVGAYLRGVVREMRRVDAAANFFDEMPKRSKEKKAATDYMNRKPLRVQNAAEAGKLIADAEKHYQTEADKASLRTKMDYTFGRVGAMLLKDTLLYGAAMAAGATAAAMNGGSPELICGAAVAAVGIVGVAKIGVGVGNMSRPLTKSEKNRPETLRQYTEAKQALFVLKQMKKQLTPVVKNNGKNGNAAVFMPERYAGR